MLCSSTHRLISYKLLNHTYIKLLYIILYKFIINGIISKRRCFSIILKRHCALSGVSPSIRNEIAPNLFMKLILYLTDYILFTKLYNTTPWLYIAYMYIQYQIHWYWILASLKRKCPQCPQQFRKKQALNEHMKEAHADQKESKYVCFVCL